MEGRGRRSAARQQVGASSHARARAAPSPSRSPRDASPPRRERAPPALAPGPSRSLRSSHSPELLPRPSPQPRLSSAEAQPRPLGTASQASCPPSSATPYPFPPFSPTRPRREPGYEAGGLEKGVGKMEVPRLDHTLNSPTSPCEEVIKNLSLEAIQLCDRDGKSDGGCEERGRARGQAPRPPRLCRPCSPGHQGLLLFPPYK